MTAIERKFSGEGEGEGSGWGAGAGSGAGAGTAPASCTGVACHRACSSATAWPAFASK